MTVEHFRELMRRYNSLLPITLITDEFRLAVGLNGSRAVLHGGQEIPLNRLAEGANGAFELTEQDAELIVNGDASQ